ncbi:MAG: DUF1122 family protein [candidate division WOR-3 bacterium]|nr:MAG: DUF1122 family protein [candidate division WOR-3 bacterium]
MVRMLRETLESLRSGINANGYSVYIHRTVPGRFQEEQNAELHCRTRTDRTYLGSAKIFFGRPPDYSPWVELFDINASIEIENSIVDYFGSRLEEVILDAFSASLNAGAKLFVEYYTDKETMLLLQRGFPVALSRLGFEMLTRGFTWFKDWYFPEGFMEGGWKLQGEKPISDEARQRHMKLITQETTSIGESMPSDDIPLEFKERALARLERIRNLPIPYCGK